jgi:hypothetical protein
MAAPLERSREAIAECREKRLRGEIATYRQSAECSSPTIFAAWKEAGYPHMDLITAWLNAREAASAQVDQKTLTPEAFERQMGELTMRLIAEERRRSGGLVDAPDSGLELQLPPATKVTAVAMRAGKERLPKKKTAEARAAASVPYVDPATGTSVQNMDTLSNLDARKKSAQGGSAGHSCRCRRAPDLVGSQRQLLPRAAAVFMCGSLHSAARAMRARRSACCSKSFPISWAIATPSSDAPTSAARVLSTV